MKTSWMRWKNKEVNKSPYLLLNIIFGLIILIIFAYSAIYPPESDRHPIPCLYTLTTGENCSACGLSRGLSHMIRGQINAAAEMNIHSISVFLFFILQFLMRIGFSVALFKPNIPANSLLTADALLSVVILLFTFIPLLL